MSGTPLTAQSEALHARYHVNGDDPAERCWLRDALAAIEAAAAERATAPLLEALDRLELVGAAPDVYRGYRMGLIAAREVILASHAAGGEK